MNRRNVKSKRMVAYGGMEGLGGVGGVVGGCWGLLCCAWLLRVCGGVAGGVVGFRATSGLFPGNAVYWLFGLFLKNS